MHRIALTAMTMCLALGGLAGPARAQEAIDLSQEAAAGHVVQGSFAPADGSRAYWLSLAPGQSVEVTAMPIAGSDPVLTVFDDGGQEIAGNDDFGQGLAAQVPLHSAQGQRVRVVVSQLGETLEGLGDGPHFTLIVAPSDWQPAEPQTIAAAPYNFSGEVRTSGEQAFIFTAGPGDTFDIRADAAGSDLDPYLRIVSVAPGQTPRAADAAVLVEDDDSGGSLAAQLIFTAPGSGTYAAIVSGVGAGGGTYSFSLDRIELPDPVAIGLDQTVQGVVASLAAPPVYRLSEQAIAGLVRRPGTLRITMNALGDGEDALDPYLKLAIDSPFGASELASDDDSGGDLNAQVTLPVSGHDDLARWLRDLRITATTIMGLDAPGGFELTITR